MFALDIMWHRRPFHTTRWWITQVPHQGSSYFSRAYHFPAVLTPFANECRLSPCCFVSLAMVTSTAVIVTTSNLYSFNKVAVYCDYPSRTWGYIWRMCSSLHGVCICHNNEKIVILWALLMTHYDMQSCSGHLKVKDECQSFQQFLSNGHTHERFSCRAHTRSYSRDKHFKTRDI